MPFFFEAAILSRIRSPVTSRSNWAKDSSTLSVRRPIELVVLNCWVTETNDTAWASKSSTSRARSASGGPARFQSEEERPRPRRAGDRSRQGRQRAVVRVLPGEAAIEDEHVIGSALPFPHQPGSGLQLGATPCIGCSGLIELSCNPQKLPLRVRAQAAKSELLHPVCDSS